MNTETIIGLVLICTSLPALIVILGYVMIKTANVEEQRKKLECKKLKLEIEKLERELKQ